MSYYNSIPITQLQPGSVVLATDVYPAVDTTDNTQSPSGTTKKYTIAQLQSYLGLFQWVLVTTATQQMMINTGYIIDNSVIPVVLTLPLTAAVGSIIQIAGLSSGMWSIAQNAGQQILFGDQTTTLGVTGGLASTYQTDYVNLLCVKQDVLYSVIGGVGNPTVI